MTEVMKRPSSDMSRNAGLRAQQRKSWRTDFGSIEVICSHELYEGESLQK